LSAPAAEAAPVGSFGRIAGRAGWALGDQALASLSNFAIGVIVARAVEPDKFGAFTLAFATYLIVLNIARAIATQPLVIRYSAVTIERWRCGVATASGTLVATGLVAGLLFIAAGLVFGDPLGPALLALGLALPALLLQDGWRSSLFAAGRGRSAFAVDLVYVATVVPVISAASVLALPQPATAIAAWGLATLPSSVAGGWLVGTRPVPRQVLSWLREHRDLAVRYAAESSVSLVVAQAGVYAVGAFAGLAGAGALRGASILLGPVFILIQGAYLAAVPEGVRIRASRPERFVPAMVVVSTGLAVGIFGWLAVLLLLPDAIGRELLGASWKSAREFLVPVGLSVAGAALAAGPIAGLRVLADARSSLRVVLLQAPVALVLGVGGAFVGGASGAAWGAAASSAFSLVLFVVAFARSAARQRTVTVTPPATGQPVEPEAP
jgi:O-antigen/teichoic acid export membrane protein